MVSWSEVQETSWTYYRHPQLEGPSEPPIVASCSEAQVTAWARTWHLKCVLWGWEVEGRDAIL